MTFVLLRDERIGLGQFGVLHVQGESGVWDAMENWSRLIAAGHYPVTLSESRRSLEGKLWSPRADHCLPLVHDVPGHDGIRIRAANDPGELEGCIAPGLRDHGRLLNSRTALIAVMAIITAALARSEAVSLDVLDAA